MKALKSRPLQLSALRSFEAVARLLSFRGAGEELHLTQSAISRQIQALEDELGTALFVRGKRQVELADAGVQLQRAVLPLLARLDSTVRQIRQQQHRERLSITTFASLATLWLLPRLPSFQAAQPQADIRIDTADHPLPLDTPHIDLALRYCHPHTAPAQAQLLFGELLSPVASPALLAKIPLRRVADLARHTLLEEDDKRAGAELATWPSWLRAHGQADLAPRAWLHLNFTHQRLQTALAGQGVALARLPLAADAIARGELVEPFGAAGRLPSPYAYWLVRWPAREPRAVVGAFESWLLQEAQTTRQAVRRITGDATAL